MKVITLEKTKERLGISGTMYDDYINAQIPLIDAKVKQITNNRYNMNVTGDLTINSPYVSVSRVIQYNGGILFSRQNYSSSGINNKWLLDDIDEYLEVGQQISGTGIPDNTYIEEVIQNNTTINNISMTGPIVKMSANATASTSSGDMYLGINIAYQDIIAKGIWYAKSKTNMTLPGRTLSSVGTVSFASEDNTIDGQYGMPSWFVKAFPQYQGGH